MLPAPTFEGILDRAEAFGEGRPLSDRLVSIVFANPTSPVWADLQGNRAFLDVRTGESWDLFFAGMSGFSPNPGESDWLSITRRRRAEMASYYNPKSFDSIVKHVEAEHAVAVRSSDMERQAWTYGGGTTLVSFMVYGRDPDWAGLRYVPLYRADNSESALGNIAEGLRRWQEEHVDPLLAPGEAMSGAGPDAVRLTAALGWSASAVAGGLLGNTAFALLSKVLQ